VLIPESSDKRYKLFFAAVFGSLPATGPLADVSDIYLKSLGGKRDSIKPADVPRLFENRYLYPLRAAMHELNTYRNSWEGDSKLFWMDLTHHST
jgi:hypothetical protein